MGEKPFESFNRIMNATSRDTIEAIVNKEDAIYKALKELKEKVHIPPQTHPTTGFTFPTPKATGGKFVSVTTPDGPVVFDFVRETRVTPAGALFVIILHDGNRSCEVFAPGQWTRYVEKSLDHPNDDDEPEARGEG